MTSTFVSDVFEVLKEATNAVDTFSMVTGFACVKNCSRCCQYPNVEINILEALPMAEHLLEDEFSLQNLDFSTPTCALYANPATEIISRREERSERRVHQTYTSEQSDAATKKELSGRVSKTSLSGNSTGGCSQYAWRPLLCRLYGFQSQSDKHGVVSLQACKTQRETNSMSFQKTSLSVANDCQAPSSDSSLKPIRMSNWYSRLSDIAPYLAEEKLPINQALQRAIELLRTQNWRAEMSGQLNSARPGPSSLENH